MRVRPVYVHMVARQSRLENTIHGRRNIFRHFYTRVTYHILTFKESRYILSLRNVCDANILSSR